MQLTEKLYDLFLLEKQIRGMQSRLDSATRRCSAQQAKHDQLLRQQEEMTDQLKHGRAKANERESMAAEIEQKIAHQRELMNNVKSNKEYSSLLIEINTYKLDKENAEQEALEQMSAVDRMDQELAEVTDKAQAQKKLVAVGQSEIEACKSEVGEQLDRLISERSTAEKDLSANALSTFKKLADIHDGDAMATVTEENRRTMEYGCGGCYLSIPVERVSTLMSSSDEIVICPNCNRMLFMDQDLKAAIVK